MLFRREGQVRRDTPAANLDIAHFVEPVGHVVGRDVGESGETALEVVGQAAIFEFEFAHPVLGRCEFGHQRLGRLAFGPSLADPARALVASALEVLQLGLGRAPGRVECQNLGRDRGEPATGEAPIEPIGIVAEEFQIMHRGSCSVVAGAGWL